MQQAANSENTDAVAALNRLLAADRRQQPEALLAQAVDRIAREEKELEAAIDEQMVFLHNQVPAVWQEVGDLQETFEVLDQQASDINVTDHIPREALSLIQQIEEIDIAKKKLCFFEDCLEQLIELEEYSTRITSESSFSELKEELSRKQAALKIALKLPSDHYLAIGAYRIVRSISQKCVLTLEPIIKEEVVFYNSPGFNDDFQQANYTHLSSTLTELYEISRLAHSPDLLLRDYIEVKLAAIKKRVAFDSSREFTGILQFSSNFLWREFQILKKAEDDLNGQDMEAFIAKSLAEILATVSQWLHQQDMGKFGTIAKELKQKTEVWENSYQRLLLVFEEAKLKQYLKAEDYTKAISTVLAPVFGLADFSCLEVEERYKAEITDKQKITEVEEKLQSLDFAKYILAIEQTLISAVKTGLSLRLANWVSSTEKFLLAINKKLEECLRIIEKFYFEDQTELREDPFLLVNLPLFHKFYARNIKLSEVWPHIDKINLPFAKLNIKKKVSVSLQEVLLTKYSDYIGFLQKVSIEQLLDRARSQTSPLLESIVKLQGTAPHSKKPVLPKPLADDFLAVNLRLMTKDLRADVSKYIENLVRRAAGNNQILMAIDQHYTQVVYKIDQICSGETDDKLASYAVKRKEEYQSYPGGKDQAGSFVLASLALENNLSGISYWKELIVCAIFLYFLMFAKSEEENLDQAKLEEDLEALKKTFRRTLKYPIN